MTLPLYRKSISDYHNFFSGTCKSLLVFHSTHILLSEFFISKSNMYSGAGPSRVLNTTVLTSVSLKSRIIFCLRVFNCVHRHCDYFLASMLLDFEGLASASFPSQHGFSK